MRYLRKVLALSNGTRAWPRILGIDRRTISQRAIEPEVVAAESFRE